MPGNFDINQVTNSGMFGQDMYNQLFGANDFTGMGDGWNSGNNRWFGDGDNGDIQGPQTSGLQGEWFGDGGINEAGQALSDGRPNQSAKDSYKGYSFNWNPTGGESGDLQVYNPSGTLANTFRQNNPSGFSRAMDTIAPMVFTALSGGMLAPAFGGGMLGGALGYGTANGVMAGMQGGNASQIGRAALGGAVSGGLGGMSQGTPASMGNNPSAYVPAQAGTSFSNMAGITNPTLGGMFNRGVGSALSTAATGGSLADSLTNGLTSAGTSGLNSMGKSMGNSFSDIWNSFSSPQGTEMPYSNNPAENASYPEGAMSNSRQNYYNILGQEPPQASVPSAEMYSNAPFNTTGMGFSPMSSNSSGMKTAQSAGAGGGDSGGGGLASFLPSGSQVGSFLGSHGGDLASMLYGFYNNRKQQQALQGQQAGLQGLYGQNSPYAQQLRAKLDAHGAQMGTRLNTGGREVQLQAMLADRAAQMAPHMYSMQQGQQGLQNKNLDILKMGFDKLGGGQALNRGLQNLFKPQASLTGPGSMEAYGKMDDMYSNMPWGG